MASAATPVGHRGVFGFQVGELRDVPVFRRADLAPGAGFDGPDIIVEEQTSTYVPDGFSARIASNAYIILERNGDSA